MKTPKKNPDLDWMREALRLAEKGRGQTSPNPLVGAVVTRNGKKVGQGHHAFFGGPHAEVSALKAAGSKSRNAVLHVTLEPCSTWGKTPPCTDLILKSGLRKIMIGSLDPNPQNHGEGIRRLRKAGISVRVGVLKKEVKVQNAPFFKVMRTGFPFVTLKMAQSFDGKIASRTGESRWISSPPSRRLVHRLRSEADAILVGKNTAFRDNPQLVGKFGKDRPWRVVLDPEGKLSSKARIFEGPQPTVQVIARNHLKKVTSAPASRPGRIFLPVTAEKGSVVLKDLLQALVSLGIQHLLVEGGGELAWSFLRGGWVDRLVWIISPKIIGGRDAKTSVEGNGIARMKEALDLKWEKVYPLGADWVLEARMC